MATFFVKLIRIIRIVLRAHNFYELMQTFMDASTKVDRYAKITDLCLRSAFANRLFASSSVTGTGEAHIASRADTPSARRNNL
jgi:hypothetical protein